MILPRNDTQPSQSLFEQMCPHLVSLCDNVEKRFGEGFVKAHRLSSFVFGQASSRKKRPCMNI
eukprot:m.259222 g.259222  ORF g.259222 m.259222 type:complete len:63 (+) comp15551_c0_seq5:2-190(+)